MGSIRGILLLDKPLGLSSSAATQRVRRLLGGVKAGHVGSLDPLATGMLPICLGEATKIAGEILEGRKRYRFTLALGSRTATGDREGEIVERAAVPPLEPERLREALAGFIGRSEQVPPMYSAIKQGGQPLYRLARAGRTVERAARTIEIDALSLCALDRESIELQVTCGKGTYVRVLAEDIARRLGTCGHVSALRRLAVEPFQEESMIGLEALAQRLAERTDATPWLPAEAGLPHLRAVALSAHERRDIEHGRPVAAGPAGPPGERLRLHATPGGELLALAERHVDGRLWPKRVLVTAQGCE